MSRIGWRLDLRIAAGAAMAAAAASGLGDAAEFLLEDANRTVPHEEGTLARSGSTDVDGLTASVFYDTPYAVRQHEDTRLHHDEGRRAKWLEQTLAEDGEEIRAHVAARLRETLR